MRGALSPYWVVLLAMHLESSYYIATSYATFGFCSLHLTGRFVYRSVCVTMHCSTCSSRPPPARNYKRGRVDLLSKLGCNSGLTPNSVTISGHRISGFGCSWMAHSGALIR